MTVTEVNGKAAPNPRMMRPPAAADYIGLATSTLAKMRLRGDGPPYIKAGPRVVVYDVADLDAWLGSRRRMSTSERGDTPPPAAA